MAGSRMKLKEEPPIKVKRSSSPLVDNLETLSKDELISRLIDMKMYVEEIENRNNLSDCTEDGRLRQQQTESQRRENVLFMRLTAKEQEVQEFLSQLEELRTSLGSSGLRNVLVDPVVNSIFQKMREELKQTKDKMEQLQHELNAWKFTPDSTTGKRLMAKCRSLIQENEELGKMIEGGRLAHLEGKLEMAKKQAEELSGGQSEVDEFLMELDEDMEGLQATVVYLQKQLENVRQENEELRSLLAGRRTTQPAFSSAEKSPARSLTPSLDEPPVLTDQLAKHTVSAVRRHEAKRRSGKHELNFVNDSPHWTVDWLAKEVDLGNFPDSEKEEVLENGTIGMQPERNGPTPTLHEKDPQPETPVSPPPRKMPRLDCSSGLEQYSPRSPEVDANLEQEDDEEEGAEEDNSKITIAEDTNKLASKYRTRKVEGKSPKSLFERMSVVENGIDLKIAEQPK